MTKKIILIGLLVAALGYALYTYWPLLSSLLPKKEPAKIAVESLVDNQGPLVTKEAEKEEKTALPGASGITTDPFSLRTTAYKKSDKADEGEKKEVKRQALRLEGVWIGEKTRISFISGQALSVGGNVRGWRVARIYQDRVVLRKGGSTKILRLEAK